MLLEHEVREVVTRFVRGELRLRELGAWLTDQTWDRDDSTDPRGYGLAYEARLLLDEYTGGGWTLDELRTQLLAAMSRPAELVSLRTGATVGEVNVMRPAVEVLARKSTGALLAKVVVSDKPAGHVDATPPQWAAVW